MKKQQARLPFENVLSLFLYEGVGFRVVGMDLRKHTKIFWNTTNFFALMDFGFFIFKNGSLSKKIRGASNEYYDLSHLTISLVLGRTTGAIVSNF